MAPAANAWTRPTLVKSENVSRPRASRTAPSGSPPSELIRCVARYFSSFSTSCFLATAIRIPSP